MKIINQEMKIGKYQVLVDRRLNSWKNINFSRRFQSKDSMLWSPILPSEIRNNLGWLDLPEMMQDELEPITRFAQEVKEEGIKYVVLLGMGGSSLAPLVFQKTFLNAPGYPKLIVLDSTHPESIRSVEHEIDIQNAIFIVGSKSGTTLETLSLFKYFWEKVSHISNRQGRYFVCITDPGTPLENLAEMRNFRAVFLSPADVGGRYSALSVFGMLPAALIGIDIHELMKRAKETAKDVLDLPEDKSSGFILGAVLGELAKFRDKLTFITSTSLNSFPDWIEQLIAESTGKNGKGIVPVVREPLLEIDSYGKDRLFVFIFLKEDENSGLERCQKEFEYAGIPVIRIDMKDRNDLSREIFCWEVAVAAAGAALEMNPFDQPDVDLTKQFTKKLMEKEGEEKQRQEIYKRTIFVENAESALRSWAFGAKEGDYFAVQAYLSYDSETDNALKAIRLELLKRFGLATTLGYGPRFLHSTGQLHKGGANNGLFLQFVDEPQIELPVPETNFSFKYLIKTQSLGDFKALRKRGRRILRINLGGDAEAGLKTLAGYISNI